jgi:hypothetical protein
MREGTGVVLVAAGAILYWALDIDIPFVYEGALGVVLMIAGVIATGAAVASSVVGTRFDIGLGLALFVIGAVVGFAVDLDVPYVLEDELGAILAIGGLITIGASIAMAVQRSRPRRVSTRPSRRPAEPQQHAGEAYPPAGPPAGSSRRRDDRHGPPTQKMRPWQR